MPENEAKKGIACSGCGRIYPGKEYECNKCGGPMFGCCGTFVEIAKSINILKSKEYLEQKAQYDELVELNKKKQLEARDKYKVQDAHARLKTMKKTPPKRETKQYCPKCTPAIEKKLP